jgi:dsDNA-binding SOS-regulon protein
LKGQSIGEKYGGWTELMSSVEGDSDENVASEVDAAAVGEPSPATEPDTVQEKGTEAVNNETTLPTTSTSTDDATTSTALSVDKKRQFRAVTQRLGECEQQLEAAVAEDDFDKAAELDEVLQQLLAQVQALNMTDEEMALALAESDEPILDSATAAAADDPATNDEPTDDEPPPQPTDEGAAIAEPTDEEAASAEPSEPDQNEEAIACSSSTTNGTTGDTGGNNDQVESAVIPDSEIVANDTAAADDGETTAACKDGATPLNETIEQTDADAVHEESNATPIPNDDDEINDNDMNGEAATST